MKNCLMELSCRGDSTSWKKGKANGLRIFELFRQSDPALLVLLPVPFCQLPEEVLNQQEVYGKFASYLLYTYVIADGNTNAGKHLGVKVVQGILGIVMNEANVRFGTTG